MIVYQSNLVKEDLGAEKTPGGYQWQHQNYLGSEGVSPWLNGMTMDIDNPEAMLITMVK